MRGLNLKEKLILITGSTSGIGKATAIKLSKLGAHVIIHGRNEIKTRKTIELIKNEISPAKIDGVYADLRSQEQIKEMVEKLYVKFDQLDVLINNAGVIREKRTLTEEGLEETFAVNYIAPFLLTNLLIDLLKKSKAGRIVNVASQVHSNHLDFNDLQYEKGYSGVKAYARSKTCLIMFTYLLAEKLKKTNITVNCLHPGIINTKLLEASMGAPVGAPVSIGAENLIYVATNQKLKNVSGKYFNNKKQEFSKELTYDKEIQKKLWKKTGKILSTNFEIVNYYLA
ncbi:MAG: SDR family NAD(P)-dependent oxidoreductase [Promethearchaeota archaeon]|nr:MAG: SDR family NAD(P)-dependent oxidoreductase [Candidatus Lokiarchaeota archaeon]